VLDASALLRFLLAETGDLRVKAILRLGQTGVSRVVISAVNWAEVINKIAKRHGSTAAEDLKERVLHLGVEIVAASAERAMRAGLLVAQYKIGYADAFCAELSRDSPDHVIVTADFDFKLVEHIVTIEFLPTKPVS